MMRILTHKLPDDIFSDSDSRLAPRNIKTSATRVQLDSESPISDFSAGKQVANSENARPTTYSRRSIQQKIVKDRLRSKFPESIKENWPCVIEDDLEPLRNELVRDQMPKTYATVDAPSFKNISMHNSNLGKGGRFEVCAPMNPSKEEIPNIAIMVPYRGREPHLKYMLNHLHPILQRQRINYQIFVVEQYGIDTFNKGRLFNAGFQIINTLRDFDCFIFHDVDLLPEDDRNIYDCKVKNTTNAAATVKHLATYVDTFNYIPQEYRRPDLTRTSNIGRFTSIVTMPLYGGVTAMTPRQFEEINGYSNVYWGWGCEDEDLGWRIRNAKFTIEEASKKTCKYTMIRHQRDPGNYDNLMRFYQLKDATQRQYHDGLSDVEYSIVSTKEHSVFTHMVLNIGSSTLGRWTEGYLQRKNGKFAASPHVFDEYRSEDAGSKTSESALVVRALRELQPINVDELRRCIWSLFGVVVLSTICFLVLYKSDRLFRRYRRPDLSRFLPIRQIPPKKKPAGHKRGASLPRNLKLNDLTRFPAPGQPTIYEVSPSQGLVSRILTKIRWR